MNFSMQDSFFIFLKKSAGFTSQKFLTEFKKKYQLRKVGHHGTLDPFATGMLLVGVNEATKFFSYIDDSKKSYRATLCLGVKTDTLDLTGKVLENQDVKDYSLDELQTQAGLLVGKILQEPPMYSAVKVGGQKLYELARKGEVIERKPRAVEVHELKILAWQKPFLKIDVTVSRGTYVRVLAEQLAEKLDTVAHLTGLERTMLCGKNLNDCFDVNDENDFRHKKISIENMLSQFERLDVDEEQARDLRQGKILDKKLSAIHLANSTFIKVFHGDRFLGLVQSEGNQLIVERLMSTLSVNSAMD